MILKWILIFFIQFILQLTNRVHIKCNKVVLPVACENIRFSSLFAAGTLRETSQATKSEEKRMFSQAMLPVPIAQTLDKY